tara:strand:+ start:13924 stop:14337 length:414 start_codon:yes stop_codon:yes gene_type:complete
MSTRVGLQGELLASSVLQGYGINNDIVSKVGYDLLAWLQTKPIRIQVKATQRPHYDKGKSVARYNFQTNFGGQKTPISKVQCDVLALVALDKRLIYFMLPDNLKSTKKIYEEQMTLDNERVTFAEVFDTLRKVGTCL